MLGHVAVVNDGKHTTLYVDGCPEVRNPSTPSTGITTLNQPWLLGGYEYGGTLNQIFYGLIGDVRIVNRALLSAITYYVIVSPSAGGIT